MNNHHYCVIMAGGVGSRFWPLSKISRPKQFLDLTGAGKSFLRLTYERYLDILPAENILVVTRSRYRDLVMEQIPELESRNLLLEPDGRNTAPCLAFATYALLRRDPEAVMVATPADLIIEGHELFCAAIEKAFEYAADHEALITLGVVPSRPDTNFGYIQVVGGTAAAAGDDIVKVKTFTEKPDEQLAEVFIQSGEFLWNSGMFVWKADTIRKEMEKYCGQIATRFAGVGDVLGTPQEQEWLEKVYMGCGRDSIDYAVMEHTGRASVLPVKFGWADIGNWDTLYEYLNRKDDDGNALHVYQTLLQETSDSIIYSSGNKLLAIKGLENYVIMDTKNVLMICPRDDRQLKEITSNIGLKEFEEFR